MLPCSLWRVQAVPHSQGGTWPYPGRDITPLPSPACCVLAAVGENQLFPEPGMTAPAPGCSPDRLNCQGGWAAATSTSVLRSGVPGALLINCPGFRTAPGPRCSHGGLGAHRELQLSSHRGLHFPQPPSCGAGSPLLWSCSLAASKDLELISLNSKESRVRSFTVFFSFLLLAFSS